MMHARSAWVVPAFAALLAAGCGGGAGKRAEARYDFGPPPAVAPLPGLASVDVAAPSWLAGSGIHYRLTWLDARQRNEYGESRWAAPPGEMLARALAARLAGSERCRLRFELDEFIQIFDSATASRWQLSGRGTLIAGNAVLARRAFAASAPAPSPDAKGGVAAAAASVADLADRLTEWIARIPQCRQE